MLLFEINNYLFIHVR